MSYESPINIIYRDVQTKLEGDVFKAIQNYNIEVNKDELLKALTYDRNQYNKGWSDGYAQAAEDIVHCKDCKYHNTSICVINTKWKMNIDDKCYCYWGVRKEDVENYALGSD